jgi:hypothetical protein
MGRGHHSSGCCPQALHVENQISQDDRQQLAPMDVGVVPVDAEEPTEGTYVVKHPPGGSSGEGREDLEQRARLTRPG